MFRFRLSTLFVVTTIVAVSTFLWMRFVVPNVTSVHIANGQVVFLLPVKNNSLGMHLLQAEFSQADERVVQTKIRTTLDRIPQKPQKTYPIHQYALSYPFLHVALALLGFLITVLLLIVAVRKLRHRP